MPQRGPIPTKDDKFNTYIRRVIPFLAKPANQTRLGVSNKNKNALVNALGDTLTAASWKYVYMKAKNPTIATKPLRDQKNTLKKSITRRLRAVYADITKSALTQFDRSTLGLPKRSAKSALRTAIKTRPALKLFVQNGAWFIVENRVESKSSRPSMHRDADYIELRYCIQETPPGSPDECNKTKILSKARYTLKLNPAMAGQRIHCYSRWANKTNEAKSGPWTRLFSAIISD